MSVSRKVLRRMKKVMGLIGTSAVLAPCSSQVSCAMRTWCHRNVQYRFDGEHLLIRGNGTINGNSIRRNLTEEEMENISKIRIDSGITVIGETAFDSFIGLKSINIPNSVTEIGKFAFFGCKSLDKITIPNSVTGIGDFAFSDCKFLKKITIPSSVTVIGTCLFSDCTSLQEITIPNSVIAIGECAFRGCISLQKITIPNSVSIIDRLAFASSGLERVKFEDMSRCDSKSCWDVLLRKNAFYGCEQLRILDFGNANMSRMAKVENDAFLGCDPNFVALEGRTVRGKFYNTVLNYHYNYFIPNAFLFDSINDRINKKNSFFKKG